MHGVDELGYGHNWDHEGFNKKFRFCPACGVGCLYRHSRTRTPENKPLQGSEFWCGLCGFSFNAKTSIEWNIALRLFKEHRKMRIARKFQERYFDPEAVAAWKQHYEKPTATNTWPSRGGNSIADKLKQALGVQ